MKLLPSQIAVVDVQGRLSLPVEIVRSLPWWKGETTPIVLECFQTGEIRLYRAEDINPAIESAASEYVATGNSAELIVLSDRYRASILYNERRFLMTRETLSVLGLEIGGKSQVFVASMGRWLQILTLEERLTRLDNHSDFPPVDPFGH